MWVIVRDQRGKVWSVIVKKISNRDDMSFDAFENGYGSRVKYMGP